MVPMVATAASWIVVPAAWIAVAVVVAVVILRGAYAHVLACVDCDELRFLFFLFPFVFF